MVSSSRKVDKVIVVVNALAGLLIMYYLTGARIIHNLHLYLEMYSLIFMVYVNNELRNYCKSFFLYWGKGFELAL